MKKQNFDGLDNLKNLLNLNYIEKVSIWAIKSYDNEMRYSADIEFKKDNSTFEQEFKGESFEDVIEQLKNFINSLPHSEVIE